MGSFNLLVAIHKDIQHSDIDIAVRVDRVVRPFMRARCYGRWDEAQPIRAYQIEHELAPNETPSAYAYIDLGGHWRADVEKWVEGVRDNQRVLVCWCKD